MCIRQLDDGAWRTSAVEKRWIVRSSLAQWRLSSSCFGSLVSGAFAPLILALLAFALSVPALSTEFYVDPIAGSALGDGSLANPWRTLQQVVDDGLIETQRWDPLPYAAGASLVPVNAGAPVKAGDTLWLRTGYHGEFFFRGATNAAPIVVAAQPGHLPRVGRIELEAGQNWVFKGLSISPSHATPALSPATMVRIQDHSWWGPTSDVTVEDNQIFSIDDASGWGASEWINQASSAVTVDATNVTVSRNVIRNVRFGISVSGPDALISHNWIDGFSGDGLRGLGDRGVFEYNRVQNAYVGADLGDPNHDDGFQSWTYGAGGVGTGSVTGVVLRGNIIINNTDPAHPLATSLQGIGCFDGNFFNWVVENNVVITDHWHGISFYGMHDSRIVNNTVIDLTPGQPGAPWIMVADHKSGAPSVNVVVRNNLAQDLNMSGINVTGDHNIEYSDATTLFVAPPFDLHLLPTAAAVDAGTSSLSPGTDVEGWSRPLGVATDIGAYEFCASCLFTDGFESGGLIAWSAASQ